MTINEIATYILIVITGTGALSLLLVRNVLHAAYLLMLVLMGASGIFICLSAEFVGVAQLMVYIGGTLVLLMFGVMLTSRIGGQVITVVHNRFTGYFIGAVLLITLLMLQTILPFRSWSLADAKATTVEHIGFQLMTTYVYEFEIVGVLLLLVLIGASYVAKINKSKEDEYTR